MTIGLQYWFHFWHTSWINHSITSLCNLMDCSTPGFPSPRTCSNSCPLSQWCHPTTSSSAVPFSSCLQSFPAPQSSLINRFFASGGQSIGASASASVIPVNIQNWFPLGLTGLISLKSKRVNHRYTYVPFLLNLPPSSSPFPRLQVITEPQFAFPESYNRFPLAIYLHMLVYMHPCYFLQVLFEKYILSQEYNIPHEDWKWGGAYSYIFSVIS